MLVVDSLGKRYGRRWIFRQISFSVSIGDRLAILGHNGSGKSTLLKSLAGLIPPTEGTIKLDGDSRISLGYAALEMALYPQLSVAEHLQLSADLRGVPARTDELLKRVNLEYAADYLASALSTGMKARLKLAMAIQPEPKVLLLDEPGASLDEAGRTLVQEIAEEQASRGALIVATNEPQERRLATHELVLAE